VSSLAEDFIFILRDTELAYHIWWPYRLVRATYGAVCGAKLMVCRWERVMTQGMGCLDLPSPRIALLASGAGSGMDDIFNKIARPNFPGELVLVIADSPDAAVLAMARRAGLDTAVIPALGRQSNAYEDELNIVLDFSRCDYLFLAGYHPLLGSSVTARYWGRILNIMPPDLQDTPSNEADLPIPLTITFPRAKRLVASGLVAFTGETIVAS